MRSKNWEPVKSLSRKKKLAKSLRMLSTNVSVIFKKR